MTPDTPNKNEANLDGLNVIVIIQVLALSYLLIDDFFVTDEPQHAMILSVSVLGVAIVAGLFVRNNIARQAMVAVASISIAAELIRLGLILFVTRSVITTELLTTLLLTEVIPLAFTIWIVVYLTREEVRRHFTKGDLDTQNETR